MKYMLANIGANLVALACVSAATYLAIHERSSWGWFLFVGVLCVASVKFKD